MAEEKFQVLQSALLQAFSSEDALRQLLSAMGLNLAAISTGGSLTIMVFDVIEHMNSHGRLDEFVKHACELRPHNTSLRASLQRYWPSAAAPPSQPRTIPEATPQLPVGLLDDDWKQLVDYIRERRLTPVIGTGVLRGGVPEHMELAGEWADRWEYPFSDRRDISRVSQYLSLTQHQLLPHEQLKRRYAIASEPDFDSPEELHGLLADLNLPLYLTTNYDDFMIKALARRRLEPMRGYPHWNQTLKEQAGLESALGEARGPLVYHLFGHHGEPESMVLTEDDHFDFLSAVGDPRLLPPIVKRAIGNTALLFIGYGVLDFGFRMLLRALLRSITAPNKRLGVAVQLPPAGLSSKQQAQVEKYLERFLNVSKQFQFRVFWGTTVDFTRILRKRWKEHRGDDGPIN